ncbi:MAG TPA: hypothetical protein VHU87_03950 [Rhizomicrobium sp.]|jgi:hypothetical protein|nr:hypothetical protein [Rhizomicrobium sp.]
MTTLRRSIGTFLTVMLAAETACLLGLMASDLPRRLGYPHAANALIFYALPVGLSLAAAFALKIPRATGLQAAALYTGILLGPAVAALLLGVMIYLLCNLSPLCPEFI